MDGISSMKMTQNIPFLATKEWLKKKHIKVLGVAKPVSRP